MRQLLFIMGQIVLRAFWRFVAWDGGPTHPSYIHARWRIYQTGAHISNFIEGVE